MPKSVKSKNQDGLSEKDYEAITRKENFCYGKMKRRHLKHLDAEERKSIARQYLKDKVHMADVASKHHISLSLTGRIVNDFKNGGSRIVEKE